MSMANGPFGGERWSALFGAMKELRASWPSRGWSWDKRLSCVTSSFSAELDAKARAAAAIALPIEWTSTTIQRAAAPLRDLAERAGGLRPGQFLLVSNSLDAAYGYGLWWPWGDGMTTSMRVGLGGPHATQDALQRLRDVFSVEL
jgi:hypothetical protein